MQLEKAIEILKQKYDQVKDNCQITDPVAWALYRTWQIADRDRKKSPATTSMMVESSMYVENTPL